MRLEEIAPSEQAATESAESVQTLLTLFRNMQVTFPGGMTNADLKPLLDSIQISHRKDRAVLHATLPPKLLEKILTPEKLQAAPSPNTSKN